MPQPISFINKINRNAVPWGLTLLTRAWSLTLNYSRVNYGPVQKLRQDKNPVIFAIYHGEIFPLCFLHRNEGIAVLVSKSSDGELIAQVLARMGYTLARGSSSRDGARALVSARKEMRDNRRDVVFTVDGPRGPRQVAKQGIIYLASRTRAFVVPARVYMSTKYVFRSWDRFSLPWLWSGCRVIYGEPFRVPARLKPDQIQACTQDLDCKLKSLL